MALPATTGSRGSIGKCELNLYEEGRNNSMKMKGVRMPKLPKQLTADEKKYLLAVERGDIPAVRRMLQKAIRDNSMDINCVDPLGRGALLMAIESENLSMVECLIVMGVKTSDALLHAIDSEFVEAVELLLEHEELIHKEGELYSWENVDRDTATFTPEITPIILAAHRNNYEIVKILLDRGASIPMPHDIRCGCQECLDQARQDCLRYSASRINSYKALASPSLIALTSTDPLLTAFELSFELKQLSFSEPEFRGEYRELRMRCQDFAVALLGHTRTSHELQVMLNFDPDMMKEDDESVSDLVPADICEGGLARLRLAINYKQKKFVSHSWVQQLLASIWYDGLPGFRQKGAVGKGMEVAKVIAFAPFYCFIYMLAPNSQTGKLIRKPFMKFLIQTSSYLFFLLLLILVSQRVEEQVIDWLDSIRMRDDPHYQLKRVQHRGNPPRFLELLVVLYIVGFIWEETRELFREGFRNYVSNMWNAIDFLRNFTYVSVFFLRSWAYVQQRMEIAEDPEKAYIPREEWDDYDPQLIAEGLFAAANIFSALKLVHTSSINPHLGPLQISLGRMIVDILKFFFFYSLVLFAFACGLNQLLWYFADLEKDKCYSLPGGDPDWKNNGEACMKWRRFGNLFEASQSLFWASFGMVGLSDFELTGIKSYTRFWGLLMFGSYSVINVIVLLNLLIAMMSNSYAMITEKADTEWKFARTKLWLSYFDEDSTLPSPFNLIPTPKDLRKFLSKLLSGGGSKSNSKAREARLSELKEQARQYTAVMRALVWRYISGMHRMKEEESVVTEDDVNEIKGEISTLRCDLVEVFRNSGMNVSGLARKEEFQSRKTREWERRLFRGFHVAPAAGDDNILLNVQAQDDKEEGGETGADKFKRMARLALLNRERLARPPKHLSQIGRSTSSESFKSRQSLKKAMEAAKKMTEKSNQSVSPVPPSPEPDSSQNLQEKLLKASARDPITERKDSTLSVVHESRTITPTPSMKDNASLHSECITEDGDRPSAPPGNEVSLMDEPLPDNVNLAKPKTPEQQNKVTKQAAPAPPVSEEDGQQKGELQSPSPSSSGKLRDISRISKSFPELTEIAQSDDAAPDSSNKTKLSMENETKGIDSPKRAPSRLSAKSGSIDINAELKKETSPQLTPQEIRKLSRDPTIEMDSVSVTPQPGPSSTVISPSARTPSPMATRIDVPYSPDIIEDDSAPLIKEEQGTDGRPESSTSVVIPPTPPPPPMPSPGRGPVVPIVTNSTSVGPRIVEPPQGAAASSSSSLLPIVGQRIDDVKTIKRPKPGGAWF